MVIKIILGVATAWATIMFGNMFWSIHRRKHVIRMILDDTAMLARFVTPDLLREPPPSIAHFARPLDGGYASNMATFVAADRIAQRRGQLLAGAVTVAIFVGSGFLGLVYLIINVIIFLLLPLGRPGQMAGEQAVEWVQIMAVLLRRWEESSPKECAAFLAQAQAPDLEALHAHVTREEA